MCSSDLSEYKFSCFHIIVFVLDSTQISHTLLEGVWYSHLSCSLQIALLQFLLLFGFLLHYLRRFLFVKRSGCRIPVERNVPLCLALYLIGIVIHHFGLTVGCIVASVPYTVIIVVDKHTGIVSAGRNVIELCRTVDYRGFLYSSILLVEQFYYNALDRKSGGRERVC